MGWGGLISISSYSLTHDTRNQVLEFFSAMPWAWSHVPHCTTTNACESLSKLNGIDIDSILEILFDFDFHKIITIHFSLSSLS